MAASRRPNALGHGQALEPESAQSGHDPRKPIEVDEERTTVDEGPPEPAAEANEDRWEEKTHREGAGPRTPPKGMPQTPLVGEDSGEVLRDTIDRGSSVDDDEDEPTVRADESHFPANPAASGTGTIDEPTVEDQARPLPPLSSLPPLPLAKPPAGKSPAPAPKPSPASARLLVTAGNDSGRQFDLTGHRVVVGRGIDCDVVLTDIAVSRKHLELAYDGQHYTLHDLGSGNGTLINDRLEDGACQLQHNDRLELGNTIIRFEHTASKADQAVVGFGNQVEVDEEASTIAGRGRVRAEPQPLSAGLLARASEQAKNEQEKPAPSVLSELVLPASPPGAAVPASSPHAPRVSTNAPAAVGQGAGLSAPVQPAAPPAAAPASQATPSFSDALPPIANPVTLGPPPQFEGELLLPIRRNRILIGIISGTLGLVLIAIVATVLRGGGGTETASTTPEAAESDMDPPKGLMPLRADTEAGDEKSAATEAGDEKPAATEAGDKKPAATEPGDKKPAATEAGDEKGAAAASESTPAAEEKLSPETWGTDEVLLAARTNGLLSKAPTEQRTELPATKKVTRKPKPVRRTASAKSKKHKKTTKPKRRAKKRSAKRKPKRTATAKHKRSGATAAVRTKAANLYRNKSFNTAANMLRTAAADVSDDDASELRSLASSYESVGTSLAKAKQTQSSNPTGSMASYRRALSLDKRVGDGVHATYIRLQLGRVAPKAAASYMAQRRYEAAKKAADAAVNYGAGGDPTVRRVRKALERQAATFYKSAMKTRKKNPASAKKLLRRVLKMVPADNPWYAKAYKVVNARNRPRDEDE